MAVSRDGKCIAYLGSFDGGEHFPMRPFELFHQLQRQKKLVIIDGRIISIGSLPVRAFGAMGP